jgi:hypothetical protein
MSIDGFIVMVSIIFSFPFCLFAFAFVFICYYLCNETV